MEDMMQYFCGLSPVDQLVITTGPAFIGLVIFAMIWWEFQNWRYRQSEKGPEVDHFYKEE